MGNLLKARALLVQVLNARSAGIVYDPTRLLSPDRVERCLAARRPGAARTVLDIVTSDHPPGPVHETLGALVNGWDAHGTLGERGARLSGGLLGHGLWQATMLGWFS